MLMIIIILECVIIHGNNNKITKNKPRAEEEKIHKKVRGSKIVQKTFFFLTGGAISFLLTYTFYMPFAMVSISDLII